MASEWEMAMGVDHGMGMSAYHHHDSGVAAAPMGHHGNVVGTYSTAHHFYGMPQMGDGGGMRVDEMLNLSHGGGAHDFFPAANDHHLGAGGVGEPSATTRSATTSDHQTSILSFTDEFYIPSEEAAELEWLSKFVDDSYSDMPNYSSAAHAAMAAANAASNGGANSAGQDSCITAAPGRGARSKRSRATAAAAAAWHSLMPRPPSQSSPSSSCSSSDFPSSKPARPSGSTNGSRGKKSPAAPGAGPGPAGDQLGLEGGVRRCTHCASEKTPQWRTGPLGPKTLCNACGVRFKSGRLVPEYRPAASPTFLLTQHSNSHRKVMELRRQKELMIIRGSHRDAAAGPAGPTVKTEVLYHDYGIC